MMRAEGQVRPDAGTAPQRVLDVAVHALVLDIPIVALLWGAQVCQATQAVLPEEFPAVALLYRSLPGLWIVHALLMLLVAGAAVKVWRSRRPEVAEPLAKGMLLCAAVAALVGARLPIAVPLVVFLMTAAQIRVSVRRFETDATLSRSAAAMVRRLLALDVWSAVRALLDVLLIAALVGALVSVLEGIFYTSWFTATLFSVRDFARFQAYALANAVVYCSVRGGLALVAIGGLAIVSRWLYGRGRLTAQWLPVSVCGLLCGTTSVLGVQLLLFVLGAEIRAVGLEPAVIAIAAMVALCGTAIATRNLQVQMGDLGRGYDELPTFRADLLACINAVAFGPLTALAALRDRLRIRGLRSRGFHYGGGIATCLGLAVLLLAVNYPKLHDYSTVAVHLYSTVLVLLAFVIGCLAGHLRRPGPILRLRRQTLVSGLAVVLVALGLITGLARANTRVLLHEYAVINRVFVDQLPGLSYVRQSNLGMTETLDPTLRFHPPGTERLPKAPGVAVPTGSPPPIILILADALRPDHLGAYGQKRPTSPHIDRLARDAVVFEKAYSASTATSCGVRCMFAGRYASRFMLETQLPPFFTGDLVRYGYRRFVLSAWPTDYNSVCMASFERGISPEARAQVDMRPLNPADDYEKALKAIAEIDRLEREGKALPADQRGWFLYLHLTATHFPWVRREGARPFGPTQTDLYDQSVNYTDLAIGTVLEALRARGLYDKAVIAVVADHGTGLMEHGRYAGFYCYEEQIRVPFILKVPGVAPRRVAEPTSLIDLAPTLINLFERGTENRFHGISLLPLMTGQQTATGRTSLFSLCAFNDAYSLLWKGRWKYIFHRQKGYRQLFDLERDPDETRNLVDQRPELDKQLRQHLGAFLWRGRDTYNNPYHFKPYVQSAPASTPH